MVRKVDNEVPFIDGVGSISHKFPTRPMVQVYDGDDVLPVSSVSDED
ncbi:MAG: hypothetical protein NZZ41_02755 [Candidatus Dojkabacteria bacterium]|nr:hypothetical protein [Candidatus Dojkabacteria bacterium]